MKRPQQPAVMGSGVGAGRAGRICPNRKDTGGFEVGRSARTKAQNSSHAVRVF